MTEEPRSVLRRALRILSTFEADEAGQSLSDMSRRAGVPLTTTHRIVRELVEWGALERDDFGRYRIGLRLWEVAALAPRSVGLQRVALPFMQDLFETTHRGVHLGVREGHEVVFIERFVVPEIELSAGPRIGMRYPLHATGVGQVLLAYSPPDLQEAVLAEPMSRYTAFTLQTPNELRRTLADIRRIGYTISERQINSRFTVIAAPIFGPETEIVAALSLIVPYTEVSGPGLGYLVQASARGISRAFGARTPWADPEGVSVIRKRG
jgi:DNA-binding IclR family transcriptional regulator